MKIINKIRIFLFTCIIAGMSFTSCDYLNVDRYVSEMTSLDSIFVRKSLLEEYIFGAADLLPNESMLYTSSYAPYQIATDENFTSWNDDRHAGTKFLRDEINSFSVYFNNWSTYYKGIRKANLILARMNECKDISEMDRRDFAGKAYFLRSYFYYLLVQQYGPVPILPNHPFDTNEEVDNMTYPRSTYDECIDYICNDMNRAAELLLETRESSTTFFQPTKGAALAVVSRVRLYQASPWFNGNKFYIDWKTADGKYFISQEKDNSKWGKAAVAAKRVIDMNTYKLHTILKDLTTPALPANVSALSFPNGAGDIDPLRSYSELFNGETSALNNPEIIYSCSAITFFDSPAWIAFPAIMRGGNGLNLTQTLVDAYRMKDGRDINDSSNEYPYPAVSEAYKPIGGSGESFSGYELRAKTAKMYKDREVRFYASIGFCHTFWPGTSYTGTELNYKNFEATYYKDGSCQATTDHPDDYNLSGYTLKKYIHPEDNLRASMRTKVFPIFRYAEILLNYAEALNELNGTYTDPDLQITVSRNTEEIKNAFNQVRYRAGLPGLTDAEVADQDNMRELIKRERMVEFACENKRYHDVRRWGDAMKEFNKPLTGMNVNAKEADRINYYKTTVITNKLAQRSFSYKMYFYPIRKYTMDKNPKLIQNPGW